MRLMYLLDTDICIYISKGAHISVTKKFAACKTGEVGMSIITAGELMAGAYKSQNPNKAVRVIEDLMIKAPVQMMLSSIIQSYAEIRSKLEKQGKSIGSNDMWIAAHALALNVTLVTNNMKEFSGILNLKLENWVIKK